MSKEGPCSDSEGFTCQLTRSLNVGAENSLKEENETLFDNILKMKENSIVHLTINLLFLLFADMKKFFFPFVRKSSEQDEPNADVLLNNKIANKPSMQQKLFTSFYIRSDLSTKLHLLARGSLLVST